MEYSLFSKLLKVQHSSGQENIHSIIKNLRSLVGFQGLLQKYVEVKLLHQVAVGLLAFLAEIVHHRAPPGPVSPRLHVHLDVHS